MKVKAFIVAEWNSYDKVYHYAVWPCDPRSTLQEKILIETREIEFEPPPVSVMQAGTIAAYRAEQDRIRADATAKVTALQQSIDEMLAITYQPDLKVVA